EARFNDRHGSLDWKFRHNFFMFSLVCWTASPVACTHLRESWLIQHGIFVTPKVTFTYTTVQLECLCLRGLRKTKLKGTLGERKTASPKILEPSSHDIIPAIALLHSPLRNDVGTNMNSVKYKNYQRTTSKLVCAGDRPATARVASNPKQTYSESHTLENSSSTQRCKSCTRRYTHEHLFPYLIIFVVVVVSILLIGLLQPGHERGGL
ncbi:unnamed protein product, partial [Ectocarpus sp. 13 AM-2016]